MAVVSDVRNASSKFQRIPAKWKDYSVCGKIIPGERLVSFKTPLSEEYHCKGNESNPGDCLQENEQFTPKDLCKIFRKRGHILGLVVDFTNTKRYYQAQEFTGRKIEYKKIKCEGKIVPPDIVVHRFKATVLAYFKKFPNTASLVGVHCTHGLNRAGYIVCRYLIECRGYSPEEAIEAFNKARGHKMERENYLDDLQKRKPKTLSAEDIDILIETAPRSDEEWQHGEKPERDYRDGPDYRRRRDTHAPYRPVRPASRGFRDNERGYRGRYRERYVDRRDYMQYGEVNSYDDRVDGPFVTEWYGRGNMRDEMSPHMNNVDDDRFVNYHGWHRYDTDRRGNPRFDRDNWGHEGYNRHETDRRGYDADRRGYGKYRGPRFKYPPENDGYNSYETPYYRERDNRDRRARTRDYR